MIKSLLILTLTALALLPTRLYSVNSETDTPEKIILGPMKGILPKINSINKDYVIRVKKQYFGKY
jgi:hypothetical protein